MALINYRRWVGGLLANRMCVGGDREIRETEVEDEGEWEFIFI